MNVDGSTRHPLGFRIDDLLEIVAKAGEAIAAIYAGGAHQVWTKQDQSPLTDADLAAERIIFKELTKLTPEIPVVSEESDDPLKTYQSAGKYVWVVDPLDGTKEFVARTGEFTVNVALLEGQRSQCGFIYVPMTGESYFGLGAGLAFKRDAKGRQIPIAVRHLHDGDSPTVLMSRRRKGSKKRPSPEDVEAAFPGSITKFMGSSLKGCLVAEGLADLYIRQGETSIWDTAAMQAIVESAGGALLTLSGETFCYDRTSLINPPFLVTGDPKIDWRRLISF